jgi:serine/threonine protein kinase
VLRILGEPRKNTVLNELGEKHEESIAPQYLVYPIRWKDVGSQYISKQARLIDFGESFKVSHPPENLGIPGSYRSPELILDKTPGIGSDLWALGCTLFEIRTGRKLFAPFDNEDDEYIDAMVRVLGKLPEPWWSTTWELRNTWYKDDADEQGRVISVMKNVTEEKFDSGQEENPHTYHIHPSIVEDPRSLMDMLGQGYGTCSNLQRQFTKRYLKRRRKYLQICSVSC